MEYEDLGPISSHSDIDWWWDVECYLVEHEPKASVFTLGRAGGIFPQHFKFIMFADQCDRRDEIADGIAAHLTQKYEGDFRVTASREPVNPGPDTVNSHGFWIDDPDYDPKYWAMKRKAYGGDGEAIFRLAETYGSRTDPMGNYLTYMWAVNCLPSGPLRTKAINKSRALRASLKPEDQERVGPLLENFRNDALRFGIGCRR